MKKEKLSLRAWMFLHKITPSALTKKISLRTWMFLKIANYAMLALLYWQNVRPERRPIHAVITLIIIVLYVVFSYYDKRKDLLDESAKENLRRTDSILLKIIFAMGYIMVFCQFIVRTYHGVAFFERPPLYFSWVIIGYCIVFLILLLSILRAVIFSVIDKRGI